MKVSYKSLYEDYKDSKVVENAKMYAYYTLPKLMVSQLTGDSRKTVTRDFQEIGALLVNNLGAKLAGLLFPASRPFFRITASKTLTDAATKKGLSPSDLQSGLAKLEQEASEALYINASYEQVVQALNHLIVTGNVLIYRDAETRRTISYGLEQFAIRRDHFGKMVDCILRQKVTFVSLDAEIKAALIAKNPKYKDNTRTHEVDQYTRIQLKASYDSKNRFYQVSQQIEDIDVGTPTIEPESICSWMAPVWSWVPGEHYGRGLVEDYAGGFAKLSNMSHSLALYGIESLRVLNLVAPGQGVDIDAVNSAECGEFVQGTKDSIMPYNPGTLGKIKEAIELIQSTFTNLSKAFMYKGSTRQAERVTATELRLDAMEAEQTLGGVYSSLAAWMQVPFAHILLTECTPDTLTGIITRDLKLDIVAGLQALGRSSDIQNLLEAANELGSIAPILKQIDNRIDLEKLADMIYAGRSVDISTIRKSEAQLKEEQAAMQQQQLGQDQVAAADAANQGAQLQNVINQGV